MGVAGPRGVVAGEDADVLGGVEGAAAELTAGRTGPGMVNGVVVVSCSMSCKKIMRVQGRSRRRQGRSEGKGKHGLIEHDMAGNDDLLGGAIKAMIAMMPGRISEKHTGHRARRKLVRSNDGGVGVA
jgi:hypothetical protein